MSELGLPTWGQRSNEVNFVVVELEAGQAICRKGAGVDIDPIASYFRLCHGRVPMNDDFAEFTFVAQKLPTYPKQVRLTLIRKRDAGTHTGMGKEEIAAYKRSPSIAPKTGDGSSGALDRNRTRARPDGVEVPSVREPSHTNPGFRCHRPFPMPGACRGHEENPRAEPHDFP
jgi:hypothetical protein